MSLKEGGNTNGMDILERKDDLRDIMLGHVLLKVGHRVQQGREVAADEVLHHEVEVALLQDDHVIATRARESKASPRTDWNAKKSCTTKGWFARAMASRSVSTVFCLFFLMMSVLRRT